MIKDIFFVGLAVLLAGCISNDKKNAEGDMTETAQSGYELVYISKGAIQCESKGLSLEETAAKLEKSGVEVSKSHCGVLTDVMFAAMCGSPTGDINLHLIPADTIANAESAGFKKVAELATENGQGYDIIPCE